MTNISKSLIKSVSLLKTMDHNQAICSIQHVRFDHLKYLFSGILRVESKLMVFGLNLKYLC